jgi:hypothetical protein
MGSGHRTFGPYSSLPAHRSMPDAAAPTISRLLNRPPPSPPVAAHGAEDDYEQAVVTGS